ncbi:hypothetical protein [Saccharopolyspora spinosa]|uniref:hypothetical protein n=1 Tax=Saccharopolyspora spinosa TaxID=60894 RepID=UPI0004986B49|nr:hypothetical protein [Saccharopolyspora spinosa]
MGPAFLGQDAGADDFAGFLPDYHNWADPVGLFGAEGPDRGPFGDPFAGDAVWPNAVGAVGEFGDRFVRGVNQAGYLSGDARFDAAGASDAGSVAGGFDFADFLSDYHDWEGSVELFEGEGPDRPFR